MLQIINIPLLTRQTGQSIYLTRYKPRPLDASRLDGLEEIDHSFSFHSLQLSMDTDECPSTTNTITAHVHTLNTSTESPHREHSLAHDSDGLVP